MDIAEKHDRFAEALDVLDRVWTTDGPVSHSGTYWSFEDAFPQPRPVQRPYPPLWVATNSTDGLAMCAARKWGVLLPQGTSLTVTAGQMKRYTEALAGVGAGPEEARVYLARATHVAPTDEQAWAEAEGPYKDFLGYADRLRRAQSGSDPGGRSPFDLERTAPSPVVDAQVHVWLPEGPDRPWPPGGADRARAMHRHEPITGTALLAEMREAGVDRAVLVPPFFEGHRNDYAIACATKAPDAFRVMARVDLRTGDPEPVRELLRDPVVAGVRLVFLPADAGRVDDPGRSGSGRSPRRRASP